VKRAKKCKMKKLKAVRSKPRLEAVCTKDGRHFQQCFQLTLLVTISMLVASAATAGFKYYATRKPELV
jgi:hypothetical protein